MTYFIYKDVQNQWRWRLRAVNNEIIAVSSEGYFNKGDCEHAIKLVKGSSTAPVYQV